MRKLTTVILVFFLGAQSVVFGLDENVDLLKIVQNRFVSDTTNNLQNGRVSRVENVTYYSNSIKATISAERKNPNGIYVFFEKDGYSKADLESFMSDTIDYY